jgi:hypothetical protein
MAPAMLFDIHRAHSVACVKVATAWENHHRAFGAGLTRPLAARCVSGERIIFSGPHCPHGPGLGAGGQIFPTLGSRTCAAASNHNAPESPWTLDRYHLFLGSVAPPTWATSSLAASSNATDAPS